MISFHDGAALHADPSVSPASDVRPSLAIIGLGRVGQVLGQALYQAGYRITAVASRDPAKAATVAARFGANAISPRDAAASADLVLLAIPDDALKPLAAELALAGAWRSGQFVVHVSGASPAAALAPAAEYGAQIGAFHPFAAFGGAEAPLPAGITFGIEAQQPLRTILWGLAAALGGHPLDLDAADKPLYHAAAVIASNYTVTLAALANELLQQLGAQPDQALRALLPLMRTTLDNLERQGLPDALTGPLVRGDIGTIQQHLAALDEAKPQIGILYRSLAHGTLPLAQQRGLKPEIAGALQDLVTLPRELVLESEA